MVLLQYSLQIVGEACCLAGVAIRDMGNEVNEVMKGFDVLRCRRRGCREEDLTLTLILSPLL
jgi:hypothetical protein